MIHVGIDNGISGALAAVSGYSAPIMTPMPVQRARKGNEIDVRAVRDWFASLQVPAEQIIVAIEEPGGSKSACAAASMAGSFHALRAFIELRGYRWHRVTPAQWQKVMIPGAKGDTKPRALAKARQLWPAETFLASSKCRVPHDGMVDACLIAEYARLRVL